jgi:hypothetical protein
MGMELGDANNTTGAGQLTAALFFAAGGRERSEHEADA